ncbi:hypothetical protein [Devosia sp. SD17-2]|jgi:hypothetical protein|uniref:hypothetical protein n=1 Tax=Devosia sp. SD17-2 TaxID=2976459 RepID=UPI0023D82344|nr:hypothetical protein [Devosia sp. SD17-2]WEJ33202.1 hypothetical protein NYQ88_20515 [Devosia sp. SD17-2]
MANRADITMKEIGTLFALLALYVLVLLTPLHQAAGLQRDLSGFGFETVASWSVCESLAADANGDPLAAQNVKCPAASLGKTALAGPVPPVLLIEAPGLSDILTYAEAGDSHALRRPDHFGQSRAPPVPV